MYIWHSASKSSYCYKYTSLGNRLPKKKFKWTIIFFISYSQICLPPIYGIYKADNVCMVVNRKGLISVSTTEASMASYGIQCVQQSSWMYGHAFICETGYGHGSSLTAVSQRRSSQPELWFMQWVWSYNRKTRAGYSTVLCTVELHMLLHKSQRRSEVTLFQDLWPTQ